MTTELRIDGPHDPDYTRLVAETVAEAVRVLNHATSKGGLKYPADAYDLLGYLKTVAAGLPQMTRQMHQFLERGVQTGEVYDDRGRDAANVVNVAYIDMVTKATDAAGELYRALDSAQQAIANLATG